MGADSGTLVSLSALFMVRRSEPVSTKFEGSFMSEEAIELDDV